MCPLYCPFSVNPCRGHKKKIHSRKWERGWLHILIHTQIKMLRIFTHERITFNVKWLFCDLLEENREPLHLCFGKMRNLKLKTLDTRIWGNFQLAWTLLLWVYPLPFFSFFFSWNFNFFHLNCQNREDAFLVISLNEARAVKGTWQRNRRTSALTLLGFKCEQWATICILNDGNSQTFSQ